MFFENFRFRKKNCKHVPKCSYATADAGKRVIRKAHLNF